MSKTFNFPLASKLSVLGFSLCLVMLQAQATSAQQSKASAAPAVNAPNVRARASETEINSTIPDDSSVDKMLEPYVAKVRALDVTIGKLAGELKKGGMGGGSLGNFVADGMRAEASIKLGQPVALVVTNSGGLRKSAIAPGALRAQDIFELLPFENKLVELEMTGEQLLNVLKAVVASREPQSGARLRYRIGVDQKPELISAKLISADGRETEINPLATYRIITIDYLLSVTGGSLAILQQAKNTKPLGVTIRDAVIDYVKAETAAGRTVKAKLDGRFVLEGPRSRKSEEPPH